MKDLATTLGVQTEFLGAGLPVEDFEAAYDQVSRTKPNEKLKGRLEAAIEAYFPPLMLPPDPTLYDRLLLGLRPKDLVATFNWDPLLAQAQFRTRAHPGPKVVYLHGSTAFNLCLQHKTYTMRGQPCAGCRKEAPRMPVLYPVREKNYRSNPFIDEQWKMLEAYIGKAYFITVFGYSAPITDAAAREILLRAWKDNKTPKFSQLEFINPVGREEIASTWRDFLDNDAIHFDVVNAFEDSAIANDPRRTCEALFARTMEVQWWRTNPMPPMKAWAEIDEWTGRLRAPEATGSGTIVTDDATGKG